MAFEHEARLAATEIQKKELIEGIEQRLKKDKSNIHLELHHDVRQTNGNLSPKKEEGILHSSPSRAVVQEVAEGDAGGGEFGIEIHLHHFLSVQSLGQLPSAGRLHLLNATHLGGLGGHLELGAEGSLQDLGADGGRGLEDVALPTRTLRNLGTERIQ